MDPQQRLLLEVAWEALEDAGHRAAPACRRSRPACSSASATSDYVQLQLRRAARRRSTPYLAHGQRPQRRRRAALVRASACRGRACASTPRARPRWSRVHLACQSLRSGECRLALAGGVNLMLSPEHDMALCRSARMLAPDGRCKTFDAPADGYVRGEGCGVVVLKRLSRRGRATATAILAVDPRQRRQPGRPQQRAHRAERPAQEAVIRAALADAGVDAGATSTTSRRTAPAPRSAIRSRSRRSAAVLGRTGRRHRPLSCSAR